MFEGISDRATTFGPGIFGFPINHSLFNVVIMETDEISYVIRCIAAIAVLLGVAGLVFTYNTLLETPQFVSLLRVIGLH